MGSEFDQILLAKRLKVEVFNIRSRVVDQDINLTGFREAYGVLQTAQCR
jgi:invasion protein IalB